MYPVAKLSKFILFSFCSPKFPDYYLHGPTGEVSQVVVNSVVISISPIGTNTLEI